LLTHDNKAVSQRLFEKPGEVVVKFASTDMMLPQAEKKSWLAVKRKTLRKRRQKVEKNKGIERE
jgi:hypothetical protein